MIRWELTTAIATGYDAAGFLGVQPAAFGTTGGDDSGMGDYQQILPHGYLARPLDRGTDKVGAYLLCATEGGKGYGMPLHDPRVSSVYPPISKGSNGIANDKGAFLVLDYDSDTATQYVPIEFDGSGVPTKAHSVQIGKDSSTGKACLNLVHANGMAIVMLDETIVIKNAAGDAYIELSADGVVLNGNTKLVGGLDVGGSGAQPVPNLTLFEAWWAGVVSAVSAVPVYGAPIGGAMATMTAALPATGTLLLRGL
jgi:hypothetical protein